MKTLKIFLFLLFISFAISAQTVFRNASWGMSQKEVMEKENFSLYRSGCRTDNTKFCVLIYKGQIENDSVDVWYKFTNDSLRSCIYSLHGSVSALKPYTTLVKYKKMLELKYGEADQFLWEWKDEESKYVFDDSLDDPDQDFISAFINGDLKRVSFQWEETNVIIELFTGQMEDRDKGAIIVISYKPY